MFRTANRSLTVLGILALVLVAVPWWLDPETIGLDEPDAAMFPGSYGQLERGHTRYKLQGPANAEIVLLVGGLTTSLEFFDDLVVYLNNAGYQTLQFDLYGRGGSARPVDEVYDTKTFVRQIDDLLNALNIHGKIHVVGQSLGGGITIAWLAENPEKALSVSVHASAGYIEDLPILANVISMPLVGDYVWWWVGNNFAMGNVANYFAEPEKHPAKIAEIVSQLEKAALVRGYRRAILSTIRNFGADNMEDEFSKVSATNTSIQLIWGTKDALNPVGNAKTLMRWIEGTPDLITLDGIGHMPLLEDPEHVHRLVLDHLKAHHGGESDATE